MSQVEQVGKIISDSINPQARVAFGITQNKKDYYPASALPAKGRAPRIKITLLANGCKWKEWDATHPPPEGPKRKFGRVAGGLESRLRQAPREIKKPEEVKIKVRQNALKE